MKSDNFVKNTIIFTLILGFGIAVLLFVPPYDEVSNLAKGTVQINDVVFKVDVARTNEERIQGLSGRERMSDNEGMLFIFDSPQNLSFWMKDMNFALDMIWIDENFYISDISKNIAPETFPKSFSPQTPSQYVLELNSGMSDKKGIKVGDKVEFSI